jgi:hypothetical protein
LGQAPARPIEAMNSIKALHLTAAASGDFEVERLTSRRGR